jgi:hypothetical protein
LACLRFAARDFAQKPLASSLPQESRIALMLHACQTGDPAASTSLHWNFATLRAPRIGRTRCQTVRNCLARQPNPPHSDGGSTPAALNPCDCGLF